MTQRWLLYIFLSLISFGNRGYSQLLTNNLQEASIHFLDNSASSYEVENCELINGSLETEKVIFKDPGALGRAAGLTIESAPNEHTLIQVALNISASIYEIRLEDGKLLDENGGILYEGPLGVGDQFYVAADGDFIQYGLNEAILAIKNINRTELALSTSFGATNFAGGELSICIAEFEITPYPAVNFIQANSAVNPGDTTNICVELDRPNLGPDDLIIEVILPNAYPHFYDFEPIELRFPPDEQQLCFDLEVPYVGADQDQEYQLQFQAPTDDPYFVGQNSEHAIQVAAAPDLSSPVSVAFIGFDNQTGGLLNPESDQLVMVALQDIQPGAFFYLVKGNKLGGGRWDANNLAVQRIEFTGTDTIPAGTILCFDIPAPIPDEDALVHCFFLDGDGTLAFDVYDDLAGGLSSVNLLASEASSLYLVQGTWEYTEQEAILTGQEISELHLNAGSQYSYLNCPPAGMLDLAYIQSRIAAGTVFDIQAGTTANDLPGDVCQPDCSEQLDTFPLPEWDVLPQDLLLDCSISDLDQSINDWLANAGGGIATSVACMEGIEIIHDYQEQESLICQEGSHKVHFMVRDTCGGTAFASADIIYPSQNIPYFTQEAQDTSIGCLPRFEIYMAFQNWLSRFGNAQLSNACPVNWSYYYNWEKTCDELALASFAEVTFVAKDYCGRMFTTSATFTIDEALSDFSVAGYQDLSVSLDDPNKEQLIRDWLDLHAEAVLSNDCEAATIWQNDFDYANINACGTYPVNFQVASACGQLLNFTANLTLIDNSAPQFTQAPTDITINCPLSPVDQAAFEYWLGEGFGGAELSDNSSGEIEKRILRDLESLTTNTCGVETVGFMITDPCGNSDTAYADIIRTDNEAPILAVDTILPAELLACGQYLVPIRLQLSDACFGDAGGLLPALQYTLAAQDTNENFTYLGEDTLQLENEASITLKVQVPIGAHNVSVSVTDYCNNQANLTIPISVENPNLSCNLQLEIADTLVLSASDTDLLDQVLAWQSSLLSSGLAVTYDCPDTSSIPNIGQIEFDSLAFLGANGDLLNAQDLILEGCENDTLTLTVEGYSPCVNVAQGTGVIIIQRATVNAGPLADYILWPNDTTIQAIDYETNSFNIDNWLSYTLNYPDTCTSIIRDSIWSDTLFCDLPNGQKTQHYYQQVWTSNGDTAIDTSILRINNGPLEIVSNASSMTTSEENYAALFTAWKQDFAGFRVKEDCRNIKYGIASQIRRDCPTQFLLVFYAEDISTGDRVYSSPASFRVEGLFEGGTFIGRPTSVTMEYDGTNAQEILSAYQNWLNNGARGFYYYNRCPSTTYISYGPNYVVEHSCDPDVGLEVSLTGSYEAFYSILLNNFSASFNIIDRRRPTLQTSANTYDSESSWLANHAGLTAEDNCPNPMIHHLLVGTTSNCISYTATYQFWAEDANGNLSDTIELSYEEQNPAPQISLNGSTTLSSNIDCGQVFGTGQVSNLIRGNILVSDNDTAISIMSSPPASELANLMNNTSYDQIIDYEVWALDPCGTSSDTLSLQLDIQVNNTTPSISLIGSNSGISIDACNIVTATELETALLALVEVNDNPEDTPSFQFNPSIGSIISDVNQGNISGTTVTVSVEDLCGEVSNTLDLDVSFTLEPDIEGGVGISLNSSTGALSISSWPVPCSPSSSQVSWFKDGQFIGSGSSSSVSGVGSYSAELTCNEAPCGVFVSNSIEYTPSTPSCSGGVTISSTNTRPPGGYQFDGPAPGNYFALIGNYNYPQVNCTDGEIRTSWVTLSGDAPVSGSLDGSIIEFDGTPHGTYQFSVGCRAPNGVFTCVYSSTWSSGGGVLAWGPQKISETFYQREILNLYPNPGQDQVFLDFYLEKFPVEKRVMINFLDKTGKIVQQLNPDIQQGINHLELNTNNLLPGVYFLGIELEGKLTMKKLIILR